MNRSAAFSFHNIYRFRLDRWWADGPRLGWLMCNPSMANDASDDPTVRKCIKFTRRWGYPGLTIVNLFDLVCTHPAQLLLSPMPTSRDNANAISMVMGEISSLIIAWGCDDIMNAMKKKGFDPMDTMNRIRDVRPTLQVFHMGLTNGGAPRHPSRLAYGTEQHKFVWPDAS